MLSVKKILRAVKVTLRVIAVELARAGARIDEGQRTFGTFSNQQAVFPDGDFATRLIIT